MTEAMDDDLVLDGNAVAGTLAEIYGDDMTTVLAECASCGKVDHVGGLLAFVHAPGIVLRCTACATVMIRIVQTPKGTFVDVRGKRMRASVRDLRLLSAAPAQAAAAKVNVHVELQPRDTAPTDLNVIGCSVDEALSRAERFLDESLLSDQRVVRFIHGYGTGQLKRALTGFLQQHPLVARFATAPPEQGGGGVTVVELKD